MEKCRVRKNDLLLVFIDLEKAIDSIPRSIVWDSLKNRGHVIQDMYDMYDGVSTNIQTLVGMTESFPIKVGLHQVSALSPFIFTALWRKYLNLSGRPYHGAYFSLTI